MSQLSAWLYSLMVSMIFQEPRLLYFVVVLWIQVTLAGLEPAIFGSEDQRLIH